MPGSIVQRELTPGGPTRQVILFSGGRDSTLAALLGYEQGYFSHLLSFETGLGYGGAAIRGIRLAELRAAWGEGSFAAQTLSVHGIVREICFKHLVSDVLKDDRQLILLGEFLSILTAAIAFCIRNDVKVVAFGAAVYQSHYPEQQPGAIKLFRDLCARHEVELNTPVWSYDSELAVKERLLSAGLTSKSLEGSTLLADLDDCPPPDVVDAYIRRKSAAIHEIVSRLKRRDGGGG